MTELPYQAEYAKTGRAACKGCKEKIDQGNLRLAIMVQSAFFDGKQPNWHHEDCFFKKRHPASVNEIADFNKLKYDDQQNIKSKIENFTGVVLPEETSKGKGKGKKRAADDGTAQAIKDFAVEYAKSSRATCKHCDIKICKDEVRICKVVYDTDIGAQFNGQPMWHHVKCFAENRQELLYFAGGDNLPGFKSLNKEDKAMLKNEIKPLQADKIPIKKLKDEPKDEAELKEEENREKKLQKQNKLYHKYRDGLLELTKSQLHELLEANSQQVPVGIDECLSHLADCLAFGALQPCPECDAGQLVLETFGYKCTGNISEWTSCSYITQEPKRKAMKIPQKYKSMLNTLKPKVGVRLFQAAPPPVAFVKSEPAISTIKKDIPIPPLKNLKFFIYGSSKDKEETKKSILRLGGLVPCKLGPDVVCAVASRAQLERGSSCVQTLREMDLAVVEPSFLDLIDPLEGTIAKSLQILKENNIAEWGADPATRVSQDIIDGKSIPKSGSMFVKSSKSGPVKLKIQGGSAVDPQSGLADEAHVFSAADGTKYTVVLTQTDLVSQKNSFYKLQVLESNAGKRYWLFRAWGRIGTTIGGNKVESFSNADAAIDKFEAMYMEKTENPWECRKDFMKVPGRYFPLDVDYSQEESKEEKLTVDSKSKLAVPVQNLVIKIFDVTLMKKTMLEFELDTEKMPLGKLSKGQLKAGYTVLSEVLKLISKGKVSQNKIIDATNRFFTLIPHDFGVKNPPLLDNAELIKSKSDMLDNLLEIEIAYSLLQSDEVGSSSSLVDAHYLKLKCDIASLAAAEPEYDLIAEYLRNTHAVTHSHYKLAIEQVFKVVREGEDKRYKPFRKLHNRRLLWHGSRVTNFAGILSQGLRIAPPEAPVTGYMFGKGIYFADMVSKSANYCCTGPNNPVGILMLCEVALGNMKECHRAENVKLKSDQHSAWGVGSTRPDPAQDRTLPDGTIVPLGTPVTHHVNTSLLYNEFIVYDVAQVNVKYLLQVKFDYK